MSERCNKCTFGIERVDYETYDLCTEGQCAIEDAWETFNFCPYCARDFEKEQPRTKAQLKADRKAAKKAKV